MSTDSASTENEKEKSAPYRYVSIDDWNVSWKEGRTSFHRTEVNANLLMHYKLLSIDSEVKTKVFIPLCGKSLDIKWFHSLGENIEVVGVEVNETACEAFFQEQSIKYERVTIDDGHTVYKSGDGRITLHCADLFKISKDVIGEVDVVWDRGSLSAINDTDHERYSALLRSLMSPSCRCLLEVMEYDTAVYGGPPHSIPEPVVRRVYRGCRVRLVGEQLYHRPHFTTWGFPRGLPLKLYAIARGEDAKN